MALTAGTVHADEPSGGRAVETRRVIAEMAHDDRIARKVGGITATVIGTAALAGAIAWRAGGPPGPLERGMNDAFFGFGGFMVVGGIVTLAIRSPGERMNDKLRHDPSERNARLVLGTESLAMSERRAVMRNVGIAASLLGATGLVVSTHIMSERITEGGSAMLFGGGLVLTTGLTMTIMSLFQSPVEDLDERVSLSAGVAPTKGGAIAGIGGSF